MPVKCNHTSVGVIVERAGLFLLFQRVKPPWGIAPCAGHVDANESFADAAVRELFEETGLPALSWKEVWKGEVANPCRRKDGDWHLWKVWRVTIATSAVARGKDDESQNLRWYTKTQLKHLAHRTAQYEKGLISPEGWEAAPGLEPVWAHILADVGIFD